MTYARESHTASLLNDGRVLVTGGSNVFTTWNTVELYDPTVGVWVPTRNLTYARLYHTASVLNDGTV